MKRTLQRLLCLLFALTMLATATAPAFAATPSQSNAVAWAKGQIGKGLDYDGAYGNQCVDLIFYYYKYLCGYSVGGDACDYAWNTLPSGWKRINYTAGFVPQPGDVAVWKTNHKWTGGYSTGGYGHIGIVLSANTSEFTAVNQNFVSVTHCTQNTFPNSVLQCVIRPNFSGQSASVSLTWEDYRAEIAETNAVVGKTCHLNGVNNTAVSKVGIYLYDENGKQLASKTESASLPGESYCRIWYDIQGELGYKLSKGTKYQYKLMVVVNGTTVYSPLYSFTTKGTAEVQCEHDFVEVGTKATCTIVGLIEEVCAKCGKFLNSYLEEPLGHDFEEGFRTDVAETCTEPGSKSQHCTRCDEVRNVTVIPPAGHAWDTGIAMPAEDGKWVTHYTCALCDATRDEDLPLPEKTDTPEIPETPTIPSAGTAYASTQVIFIDGVEVILPAYALKNDQGYLTNYVLLRDIAYLLNGSAAQFDVGWFGKVNILPQSAYNGNKPQIPFAGDRGYASYQQATMVGGNAVMLGAITLTDDTGGGYTYYKLRDLGQMIGFNVQWISGIGICINTKEPYVG